MKRYRILFFSVFIAISLNGSQQKTAPGSDHTPDKLLALLARYSPQSKQYLLEDLAKGLSGSNATKYMNLKLSLPIGKSEAIEFSSTDAKILNSIPLSQYADVVKLLLREWPLAQIHLYLFTGKTIPFQASNSLPPGKSAAP